MKFNTPFVYSAARNSWSLRQDGYLFVLARGVPVVPGIDNIDGLPIDTYDQEYMIVAKLGAHPKGWVVEPVAEFHELVHHDGFEVSGSGCSTMAYVPGWKKCITPGRLNNIVLTTDNINPNWPRPISDEAELDLIRSSPNFRPENLRMTEPGATFIAYYKRGYIKPTPDVCYVKRGETRLAGVPSIAQIGTYWR